MTAERLGYTGRRSPDLDKIPPAAILSSIRQNSIPQIASVALLRDAQTRGKEDLHKCSCFVAPFPQRVWHSFSKSYRFDREGANQFTIMESAERVAPMQLKALDLQCDKRWNSRAAF